jgi:hypothetical protein
MAGKELISKCKDISDRSQFPRLLNTHGLNGIAVEVGVWLGHFSYPFMNQWRGNKMYLVDPWQKLEDYDDLRSRNFDSKDYGIVLKKFGPYIQHNKVGICRHTSKEAATILPDNLDFVYIDANHAYKYVLEDMKLWWPKVKDGGILAGHDFYSIDHFGVTQAVIEFATEHQVQVEVVNPGAVETGGIDSVYNWMIRKNW